MGTARKPRWARRAGKKGGRSPFARPRLKFQVFGRRALDESIPAGLNAFLGASASGNTGASAGASALEGAVAPY